MAARARPGCPGLLALLLLLSAGRPGWTRPADGRAAHSAACVAGGPCSNAEPVQPDAAAPADAQAVRRTLAHVKLTRGNPYGARYTLAAQRNADAAAGAGSRGAADGARDASKGRSLAEAATDGMSLQQQRRERRKSQRIARHSAEGGGGSFSGPGFGSASLDDHVAREHIRKREAQRGSMPADHVLEHVREVRGQGKQARRTRSRAGFGDKALEDHVAQQHIKKREAQRGSMPAEHVLDHVQEVRAQKQARQGLAGEGQLGLTGPEQAAGVDSGGVAEHMHDDPLLQSGGSQAGADAGLGGAGAALNPRKQPRAAGADSAALEDHMAGDLGEELLEASGSIDELSHAAGKHEDASERDVDELTVRPGGGGYSSAAGSGGTVISQREVAEAARDTLARPGADEEVDISAVGLMPADWAAVPDVERGGAASLVR